MRKRQVLFVLSVALLSILAAGRATFASDISVTTATGLGDATPIATLGPSSFSSTDWTATLSESVFQCTSPGGCTDGSAVTPQNDYSYVFTVTNTSPSNSAGSTLESLFTSSTYGDLFSSGLNYGLVTGSTSGGVAATFTFGGSLQVNITSGLAQNQEITFYAQSTIPPGTGTLVGLDNLTGSTPSLDPGPEPKSILLFGTGLLGLGIMVRRRQAVS